MFYGILMADVKIYQAKCTQSFAFDKNAMQYKSAKEDFTLSLVIDQERNKAYTKGSVGQSELIIASTQQNGVTLLEKVLEGIVVYHANIREKKLFISKTYDFPFNTAHDSVILTIVCDLN